jgi:predicted amidohydrolase
VPAKVRIAAAQYPLERFRHWGEYRAKLTRWVAEAAHEHASLLVFPEYAPMELVSVLPGCDRRRANSLAWETDGLQRFISEFRALHAELAQKYGVYILGGSLPVRGDDGLIRNTAYFFSPDGLMGSQEKVALTRWEREAWGMTPGSQIRFFDAPFGPIGIAICYDVEFPLIARSQAEAKVRLILAPSCTDWLRGYHRVRVGARARALENQVYVIQAPTLGATSWLGSNGTYVGSAGVYAPPDLGPRENGVLAQGQLNEPGWVFADLDLASLERIRLDGFNPNHDEWAAHERIRPAVPGQFQSISG